MAKIAIVGAGQAGLHLGIGLLLSGHQVTMLSNRTGEQIAAGPVISSQSMYGMALGLERELGIDYWQDSAPQYAGAQMRVADSDGNVMLFWQGAMDEPGQSIDQRVKMPVWIDRFIELGGDFRLVDAGVAELEELAGSHDLVVVASGKGEIGQLFTRNPDRSPFTQACGIAAGHADFDYRLFRPGAGSARHPEHRRAGPADPEHDAAEQPLVQRGEQQRLDLHSRCRPAGLRADGGTWRGSTWTASMSPAR